MINRLTRVYYLDDLLLSETDKYVMRIKLDSLNPVHQSWDSVIMINKRFDRSIWHWIFASDSRSRN